MNAIMPSLTMQRIFRAPLGLVYAAWTRPEMIVAWWGPHHTRCIEVEADLRVGGLFRTVIEEPGVGRHEVSGRYIEVASESRLVFSWAWAGTPERVSRVTVSFRAVNASETEVTLLHDRFVDAEAATRHSRGWRESLERLEAYFRV